MTPSERVAAQIHATEANIRLLSSLIRGLKSELVKERQVLSRLWFQVLPVGKIPTELLLEIFALVVEPTMSEPIPAKEPFDAGHPFQQALRLSQVCSSWRQIVLHAPRLWAAGPVDVRLQKMEKHPRKSYLAILQALLDRSAPFSFTISIWDGSETSRADEPFLNDVARLLTPTMSRWKVLSVNERAFEIFARMFPGPFTALESVDFRYEAHGYDALRPVDTFALCPRLCSVKVAPSGIYRMSNHAEHDVLRMPWVQLTQLHLSELLDAATCRSILLQCTNIVAATLETIEWDKGDLPAPLTVLPFLTTLEMRFRKMYDPVGEVGVGAFFRPLSLPALADLNVEFDCAWPTQDFSAFQNRSPNLVRFSLKDCPISAEELCNVLRLSPKLIALALESKLGLDTDFLQALNYNPTQQLVPRLQELYLQGSADHFAPHIFEAVVRSRMTDTVSPDDVARLRRVFLKAHRYPHLPKSELRDRLQDLVECGLELYIY
ncbi:hypothetical protein B0H16DRAFT_1886679 [Mycena metata]|uniref:F-box domain-containing protein n=1 Tax=Mycena metata TaxID=1033252 RepID=A0AAD7J3X9_9AGAR|nr:hypothetical protein B0H16DRAFT_1886679 [Mycena metata]